LNNRGFFMEDSGLRWFSKLDRVWIWSPHLGTRIIKPRPAFEVWMS
jgi:hypothetical protein